MSAIHMYVPLHSHIVRPLYSSNINHSYDISRHWRHPCIIPPLVGCAMVADLRTPASSDLLRTPVVAHLRTICSCTYHQKKHYAQAMIPFLYTLVVLIYLHLPNFQLRYCEFCNIFSENTRTTPCSLCQHLNDILSSVCFPNSLPPR